MNEDPSSGFDSVGGARQIPEPLCTVVSDGDNGQATHRAVWEEIVGAESPVGIHTIRERLSFQQLGSIAAHLSLQGHEPCCDFCLGKDLLRRERGVRRYKHPGRGLPVLAAVPEVLLGPESVPFWLRLCP